MEPRVPSQVREKNAETRSRPWMQVMSRLAWRTQRCVQISRGVDQGDSGGERCGANKFERNEYPWTT